MGMENLCGKTEESMKVVGFVESKVEKDFTEIKMEFVVKDCG